MSVKILIPLFEPLHNYSDAVKALGGEAEFVDHLIAVDEYDGLLLPGGGDVDPTYYYQALNGSYPEDIDPVLDELQFSFTDRFVKAGKPILGICRGLQLLNVYFGGSLIQHLPTVANHSSGADHDLVHKVHCCGESYLSELYGHDFIVNSHHHQAIDRLGEELTVTLRSDDGVIEAIEHTSKPIIGVQFHPERMCFRLAREDAVDGSNIIKHFLDLCEK